MEITEGLEKSTGKPDVRTGAVSKTLSTRRARGLRAATAPSAVHPWPPTSLFTRSMLLRPGALHSLSDVLPARKVNTGLRRLDNLGSTTAYARVEFSGRRAVSPRREQDSSSAPEGREGRADRNDTVLMCRSHSKHHLKPLPRYQHSKTASRGDDRKNRNGG
jgi:hypothetical protein